MVLGDCGVGKTSLVKALKGSRKEQTLSSDQVFFFFLLLYFPFSPSLLYPLFSTLYTKLKTKEKRKREYGKQKLTCSEGVEEGGDWEECGWEEEEGGGGGGEMGGNISVSLWEFEKRFCFFVFFLFFVFVFFYIKFSFQSCLSIMGFSSTRITFKLSFFMCSFTLFNLL